ncbi:MAG: TetR/AcrR family transcriptional regulator [Acidobacteria bacterium]|nr:TetR/AcrR family transcriptional regulator [Acidobacteriota bacterium]
MKQADQPMSRGRPRDKEAGAAILRAAQKLLAETGYARMSLDAVAALAGVTKPTIYRRFRGKSDLATAAIADLQAQEAPEPRGACRDDLVAALRHFQKGLGRPRGMAMIGTVLVEEGETPELLESFRERVVLPRRRMLLRVLEAAAERKEIRPGADLDAVVNLLVGSFYARHLTGQGIPRDWPERVVDEVWRGLSRS